MESTRSLERRLIFQNLANGVPIAIVARDFHKQPFEVMDDFRFVVSKIKSYGFVRVMPYIPCETLELANKNRVFLFDLLEKLNLDNAPAIASINEMPLEAIL